MPQEPISSLSVSLGGTMIHNVTSITLTGSGVTLVQKGQTAAITISGGGGSGQTAGLGIDPTALAAGTIGLTGTIQQPAGTGSAKGTGIFLQSGLPGPSGSGSGDVILGAAPITSSGTISTAIGGYAANKGGYVTLTDPAGVGIGGYAVNLGGSVYSGTVTGTGGYSYAGGGEIEVDVATGGLQLHRGGNAVGGATNTGGAMMVNGGQANGVGADNIGGAVYGTGGAAGTGTPGTLNTGGDATWEGGFGVDLGGVARVQGGGAGGAGTGGALQLGGGNGSVKGGIVLNPQPGTIDPLTLGELFEVSISAVGFVLAVSQG